MGAVPACISGISKPFHQIFYLLLHPRTDVSLFSAHAQRDGLTVRGLMDEALSKSTPIVVVYPFLTPQIQLP